LAVEDFKVMTSQAHAFNSDKFAFEVFADEIVVLDVGEGTYFALGGWAVDIWQGLVGGQRVDLIVDTISRRYKMPADVLAGELSEFIGRLKDDQILMEAEPAGEAIALPESFHPFRPLSFEKHIDMQDLLTLDPIHDVDPEKGWPTY
jgi:hypothetical protein